ncbi:MAG: hypothetical protein GY797_20210 [Deltaproteobacteria bacterium]|nr:hypothetical protein [Deltaproteobacteria bacterium]
MMKSEEIISFSKLQSDFPEGEYINAKKIHDWLIRTNIPEDLMAQDTILLDIMREWALNGDEIAWSPKGWRVNVAGSLVHVSLASAITWATLSAIGIATSTIPLVIVPMVAPCLFQIEKISLTRKEETILANLPLKEEILCESPDAIYESLPDAIKEQVNPLDFLDFLSKLTEVGQAKEMKDGQYNVRKLGNNTISIKWS